MARPTRQNRQGSCVVIPPVPGSASRRSPVQATKATQRTFRRFRLVRLLRGRSVLTNNAWDPAPLDNVWNPGPLSAWWYGGGGTSRLFVQPWWQQNVMPSSIANYFSSTPGRAVPDVALDADQKAGKALGFANPALYAGAATAAYRDIVDPANAMAAGRADYNNGENANDGVTYSLRTLNFTGTLHTIKGRRRDRRRHAQWSGLAGRARQVDGPQALSLPRRASRNVLAAIPPVPSLVPRRSSPPPPPACRVSRVSERPR